MAKIKNIIKAITPPIIINFFQKLKNSVKRQLIWTGDYKTWEDAQARCTGYSSEIILERVKNSLLKVKNGEAVYERDSVLFDEIQYNWALLAGLLKAALENDGKLCVLDFGGSLGSSYFQNQKFLSSLKELHWCIVEQTHFVDCGKEYVEDEHIEFFDTIEKCMTKYKPNVILLSSVLQYLEKPYDWIEKFVSLNIPYIILDRTSFIASPKDRITVQNVPQSIYLASYPCWFFNEKKLMHAFRKNYKIIVSFDALDASNVPHSYFKGFILKRISC